MVVEVNTLLETFRVEKINNYAICYDLQAHTERLLNSIKTLAFNQPSIQSETEFHLLIMNEIKNILQYQLQAIIVFEETKLNFEKRNLDLYKLKIEYQRDAKFKLSIEKYTKDLNKTWQIKVLEKEKFHIESQNSNWQHKFYPRIDLKLDDGLDEMIWTNEKDQICEGSFTNIFFQDRDECWHSPSLESNILPGIIRQKMIKELNIKEGIYYKKDLEKAKKILLSNSMIVIKEANLCR